jgi:hypothetical protein
MHPVAYTAATHKTKDNVAVSNPTPTALGVIIVLTVAILPVLFWVVI